jgi:hypothetical protein
MDKSLEGSFEGSLEGPALFEFVFVPLRTRDIERKEPLGGSMS